MCSEGIFERYVNFYTDFAFKKLFGTEINKELLISFLNALLHDREEIEDLTYLDDECLGTRGDDSSTAFNVHCINKQGEHLIVGMQKCERQSFEERSMYYAAYTISGKASRRIWNYDLKSIYIIGIMDFTIYSNHEEYYHVFELVDTTTNKTFNDKLTFIYLEMPKFTKTEAELETLSDKWLYVIRNLSTLTERPRALQEKVFTHLFEVAEIAKFDRKERYEYEESLKNYRDRFSVMETAEIKGMEQGLTKNEARNLECD